MTRRLFTLAALLSLGQCLMTAVLWVQGRHHAARFVLYGDLHLESAVRDVVVLRSEAGFCTIYWITRQPPTPPPRGNWVPDDWDMHPNDVTLVTDLWQPARTSGPLARLGFAYIRIDEKELKDDLPGLSCVVLVGFPHWFLAVPAAILPTAGLWRRLRGRHRQQGLCKRCSYDLRATPHRCPECGRVPA